MKTKICGYELDLTPKRLELLGKLRELFDDENTVLGVLVNAKHPDDTQGMNEYIEKGEDVDEEQIILHSLYLPLHRRGKM